MDDVVDRVANIMRLNEQTASVLASLEDSVVKETNDRAARLIKRAVEKGWC